ncbi:E3 ubiquitin-protein ligase RNF123 [Galendromus occidentalis]|uniref:RING-type E3 ubiquitin transferase n=1 Tax=Galendromus occidentalis TaxID=34638 RepID=A0AAJ7SET8_9ACAR|nr:E3 ubiquitin-protein ligase RNF123 [Galendromus occidentalis]
MADKVESRCWPLGPQAPPPPNPWIEEMLKRVYFTPDLDIRGLLGDAVSTPQQLSLPDVYDALEKILVSIRDDELETVEGRLGPKNVAFDINSNVGSLVISQDRLGVTSQSNFNTVKANCCVYKGRWQYEVSLGSKGVMQVGWATAECEFNEEEGVGDTKDSYAFDGNRIRKWNVSNMNYGVAWLAGDVIGCCLDLDSGSLSFYRNGVCLGEAFKNIRRGPGYAYFPAVSLSFGENLVANFGTSRFRYPVDGYSPLVPATDTRKGQLVCDLLYKALKVYEDAEKTTFKKMSDDGAQILLKGNSSLALLVAAPVVEYFPIVAKSPYVLEATLVPLLEKLLEKDPRHIANLLNMLWTLLEWQQIHLALEKLSNVLISSYSFASSSLDYGHQKRVLQIFVSLLSHKYTRRFLMCKVLFEKGRFSTLMKVKPLDIQHLEQIVPQIWFEVDEDPPHTPDDASRRASYCQSRDKIKAVVSQVEALQIELLQKVTQDDDNCPPLGQTSRDKFLCEFEKLLKEHSLAHSATTLQSNLSTVAISYLHRLISIIRRCLPIVNPVDGSDLRESCFFVPVFHFLGEQWTAGDTSRVGGLYSHLKTTYATEMKTMLNSMASVRQPARDDVPYHQTLPLVDRAKFTATIKVLKLVDSVVRLYSAVVHEQLEKAAALRDSMKEYLKAYRLTLDAMAKVEENSFEQARLSCSKDVFKKKLDEQARQMAWLSATMFSREKQGDLYWLLQVVLFTLEESSKTGECFAFVPDFYVETCIKLFHSLTSLFPPTSSLSEIPGHYNLQVRYSTFLAMHFSDKRVVNADLKETLIQALAQHVCPPETLRSLECMSNESSQMMVAALLRPYDRAWAQSNWILVRLWKGCGFAFRYSEAPHLVEKKMSLLKPRVTPVLPPHPPPCPSVFYQNLISKYLEEHPTNASAFIESVLTQLNWAFSEFVSMLQEIQTAHIRPERVLIDSRHLKVCSTCFNLTVALLRVIEMIANLSPNCLLRPAQASSMFLPRLFQTLSHILNRVCYGKGCFDLVVSLDIIGLESIDHFVIISAVAGILIALLLKGPKENRELVLQCLFQESSFQPQSVEAFLGFPVTTSAPTSTSSVSNQRTTTASAKTTVDGSTFSLANYGDVKEEEIDQVRQLIQLIKKAYASAGSQSDASGLRKQQSIDQDSEDICTICYAAVRSAVFQPCLHESCRDCIQLHLINHKECFYCKTLITKVETNPPVDIPDITPQI